MKASRIETSITKLQDCTEPDFFSTLSQPQLLCEIFPHPPRGHPAVLAPGNVNIKSFSNIIEVLYPDHNQCMDCTGQPHLDSWFSVCVCNDEYQQPLLHSVLEQQPVHIHEAEAQYLTYAAMWYSALMVHVILVNLVGTMSFIVWRLMMASTIPNTSSQLTMSNVSLATTVYFTCTVTRWDIPIKVDYDAKHITIAVPPDDPPTITEVPAHFSPEDCSTFNPPAVAAVTNAAPLVHQVPTHPHHVISAGVHVFATIPAAHLSILKFIHRPSGKYSFVPSCDPGPEPPDAAGVVPTEVHLHPHHIPGVPGPFQPRPCLALHAPASQGHIFKVTAIYLKYRI